ncbi:MAG: YbjQ family protein [Hyphomicrobium sp.]|nr:YbjQ family protein [Hyphomicrobium sp.]
MLVVTTNDIEGYRVVRHLGVVRGLTVRSRSVVGNIGAAIQIFFGGNITVYTKLAEQTRQEAFNLLVRHAEEMGANAVMAMRYDANEIAAAVTEVLAYGTAVVIAPIDGSDTSGVGGAAGSSVTPSVWSR